VDHFRFWPDCENAMDVLEKVNTTDGALALSFVLRDGTEHAYPHALNLADIPTRATDRDADADDPITTDDKELDVLTCIAWLFALLSFGAAIFARPRRPLDAT
jgi:hypothetical protein